MSTLFEFPLETGIDAQAQVMPGEDADELRALTASYHGQFQPTTPLEHFLVDALVYGDWQLRRLRRVEAQIWKNEMDDAQKSYHGLKEGSPLGQVFSRGRDVFTRLQRRMDSTERSYYRALNQLQRLQTPTRVAPPSPVPDPPPPPGPRPASDKLGSFLHSSTKPAAASPAGPISAPAEPCPVRSERAPYRGSSS